MPLVNIEKDAELKQFAGRTVRWVQTPETTGGKYNSICIVEYEPGARAKPAHAHDNGEETIYVVSGAGKVKIGEKVYELDTGSVANFPQGVPHMVWNTGNEPLKLACFYGPDISAVDYTWYEDYDFEECK